jgi:hypothetical protein
MSFIQPVLAASLIFAAPAASFAFGDSESGSIARVDIYTSGDERTASAPKRLSSARVQPDYSLPPAFGSVSLQSGFTPDPYVVEVLVGGELSANSALSGQNIGQAGDRRCRGNIAEAPDFRLQYEAGSILPLIFRVDADFDTTLVVNGPDGTWYCDDDSGPGVQAALQWDRPQSGQYDIWVGAFSSSRNYEPATLEISELTDRSASFGASGGGFGGGGSASGLDFSLPALNGVISLETGFLPDPRTVNVSARSQVSVSSALSNANISRTGDGNCRGHTGAAPDLSVRYTAGDTFPLVVRAIASYDTTLVVNDPNGGWHCDDDSGQGVQAQLVFERPVSGRYDIWFGSFSSNRDGQRGRIEISELD